MFCLKTRRLGTLAVAVGLTLMAGRTQAQYVWTAAASGNWSITTNWQGGMVPTSAPTTTISFGNGIYTATDDLAPAPFTVNSMTFGASGTATISQSAAQGFAFDGTAPTINMGAGNAIINANITVPSNNMSINGGAGALSLTGSVNSGAFNLTKNSTGSLTMTGGGSVNQLLLNAGATTITGGTFAMTQTDSGAREPSIGIGEVTGTASLTINGGATINVGDNIFIGDVAGSTGTMTVSGAGTVVNRTNTASGVGRLAVGNFGSGTLNILNGAVVNTAFLFTPREPGTNTGTIVVDGPGSALNISTEASFASNGFGTATFSHGASLTTPANVGFFMGINGPGNGVVTFTDPGTTGVVGTLLLAYTTGAVNSTVNVLNGATLTALEGAFIANGGGSQATVNVSGVGSALLAPGVDPALGQNLTVGQAGTGVLNISAGGTARSGLFFIGDAVGSSGTVNLTGFGSSLIVSSQSLIAGDFDGTGSPVNGGTGVINAGDGTVVSLGQTNLYGGGTLNVNTGYLGSFTVAGLNDGIPGSSVGTVAVGAVSTLTINTAGNNATFSGVISGAGGITKMGAGTQTLTGTNTFTGPVEIDGGAINFSTLANLGAGTAITFNGGTLQYAAGNTADISARTVTINSGGATIDTGANNVTFANTIGNKNPQNDPALTYPPSPGFGAGALTKLGTGTLTLAPAPLTVTGWPAGTPGFNNYIGGTNVLEGTLSVASDLYLGAVNTGTPTAPVLVPKGDVTGAPAGTLLFTGTTSTSRKYTMNGGTIAVASGQTLTLSGNQVSGATLNGPGTFTTAAPGEVFISSSSEASAAVVSSSANDQFVHFSNSGAMSVAAGVVAPTTLANFNDFRNQGSGTLTIGAGSKVNVADFQSSGTLTLTPGPSASSPTQLTNIGSSKLSFNGGSRTFISTPTAAQFLAGIDLKGKNAVVAGGLFVNNGYVIDSTNGPATVVADFGSLVKGAGFYQNGVITINGGKFQAGNSPGVATLGSFTLGSGGVSNYVFAIDNATGAAGPSPNASGQVSGWGLVKAVQKSLGLTSTAGNFSFTADAGHKVTVALDTLVDPTTVGTDVPGQMSNFDPSKSYSWSAVRWSGSYSGPTDAAVLDAATAFDTTGFLNPVAGSFGWSLDAGGHGLSLTYTPSAVPEPGTLALLGAAAAVGFRRLRRKK
jgi:T5SS/PEP-CTERM-associated repeat protein/autotransporter-associated beta strand protein